MTREDVGFEFTKVKDKSPLRNAINKIKRMLRHTRSIDRSLDDAFKGLKWKKGVGFRNK